MAMIAVGGVNLPAPSKFEWSIQDVSIGESGRDDTGYMYKGRVTSKRKLVLEWKGKDPVTAKTILLAFRPEYVNVTYFDPLDGDYATRNFYTGDQTAPVKIWTQDEKIYETVAFDIIER